MDHELQVEQIVRQQVQQRPEREVENELGNSTDSRETVDHDGLRRKESHKFALQWCPAPVVFNVCPCFTSYSWHLGFCKALGVTFGSEESGENAIYGLAYHSFLLVS